MLKGRLTVLVGALLLIGMLLVNFVTIIFWQRDALQREVHRDQAVLAHLDDLLGIEMSTLHDVSQDFFSFADFYPSLEKGRILCKWEKKSASKEQSASMLDSALGEVIDEHVPVVHYSGSFFGLISLRNPVLVSAQPVVRNGQIVGSIGISRSLVPMYQSLWRVEQIILVYIVINLLILTVIGFFRMRSIVVQPIDDLVQLADQYNDSDHVLFASQAQGGEFGQLSVSLNRMLARIEQDRKILEENIGQLRAANQKLTNQQQEMVRAEKLASVGRMAAGLAHEIGNPLGVVQGYLGMLAQDGGQSAEHYDFIQRSEQELQRVNVLIRQLLDFARVSKGRPDFFSLHELLGQVLEMIRVQPVFKTIQLLSSFDAPQDTIHADQDQLRQVFINALLNSVDAVKSSSRHDGVISIRTDLPEAVPARDGTTFVRVRIHDNGVGIAAEHLAVVFDPFYTTKEPGKGTGLGLSVSLSIVEAMGGRIEVESVEGQGTELSIFLPLI